MKIRTILKRKELLELFIQAKKDWRTPILFHIISRKPCHTHYGFCNYFHIKLKEKFPNLSEDKIEDIIYEQLYPYWRDYADKDKKLYGADRFDVFTSFHFKHPHKKGARRERLIVIKLIVEQLKPRKL